MSFKYGQVLSLLALLSCSLHAQTKDKQEVRAKQRMISSASELGGLTLSPGDTVVMKNGDWIDQKLVFNGNGNEMKPIVLRAENNGKVVLKGTSSLQLDGTWLVADGLYFTEGYPASGDAVGFTEASSNCRVTNVSVVAYSHPDKEKNTQFVSLRGHHNRVDHCYLAGKTNIGPTMVVWLSAQANYHRIDHNYFGHRTELGENGGESIRVGTSDWSLHDSYATVENNYFEHCDGELEVISNKSCHNTYRYNTFFECRGTLTLRHGNFASVYGNFFIGNGVQNTGGIRIIGEDHKVFNNYLQDLTGNGAGAAISIMNGVPNSPLKRYFQVKRALVVCNTIVNCAEPFEIGTGNDAERTLCPLDCTLANNVVQGGVTPVVWKSEPVNLHIEGNIMSGADREIAPVSGIELKDPKLSRSTDGLWRPSAGSPLKGAFKGNHPFVTEDMDGQFRELPKDAGADQLSAANINNRPLTRTSDVGPDWWGK